MLHRLTQIPMSTENYNVELNTIKYLAQVNGYDPNIIDRKLNKIKNRQPKPQTPDNKKYITLTYRDHTTNKIARTFSKNGYSIAFRTTNKLGNIIKQSNNTNNDKYDSPGVYKLNCNDCNKFYIGQTKRNFKTRYKEHIKALNTQAHSTYAEHLLNDNHSFKDIYTNLDILHIAPNNRKIDTLEQYEIYKHTKTHKTDILNEQKHFKANILFEGILNSNLTFGTGTAAATN